MWNWAKKHLKVFTFIEVVAVGLVLDELFIERKSNVSYIGGSFMNPFI